MADADVGWAHAAAIGALLDTTTYPVYIGEVDTADDDLTYPHLVCWPPPASRPTTTLAGYGGEASTTTQITAAGRDVREVLAALDRASAALHRRRPAIAGRRCSLITQIPAAEPPQPERDPDVSTPERPVFFSFIQVSLTSSPVEPLDVGGS
ncbi:hypothetical protein O7626_40050 [Micromonospora sp. WMMD1102]|uniref:hypothetical protein n=1 Tax=Micromonospora sp. WMMD1102 TaxID=3016105 RepID=UPI0024154528|nr:hypothetical protein [Micromonospora sp. WMMD1102]MDG4792010.1 hypothetical protein [Micromonospora sp. WMMD1102]